MDDIHVPAIDPKWDVQPAIVPLQETLNEAYGWLDQSLDLLANETKLYQ